MQAQDPERTVAILLQARAAIARRPAEMQDGDLVSRCDRERLGPDEAAGRLVARLGEPVAQDKDAQRRLWYETVATETRQHYWEDRHARGASLDSVGWTGLGRAFNGWMYEVRRRIFLRVVPRFVTLTPQTRVLDVGSGTGFYLRLWRQLGAGRVEGSDLSERAVEWLRTEFPDTPMHVLDLGAEPLGLEPDSYDAVSAMDMLFHILDDDAYRRALGNLARLARPGGTVIITENMLDGRRLESPAQTSRSEQQIVQWLGEAGLQPIASVPMFVLLNGPADSTDPRLERWWTLLTKLVSRHEAIGWTLGALLTPIELVAVRRVRRGPSTKLLICRRSESA